MDLLFLNQQPSRRRRVWQLRRVDEIALRRQDRGDVLVKREGSVAKFDIEREDLERLLQQVELQAMVRSHRPLLCRDSMARDVISVPENATADEARKQLLDHNARTLPVVDAEAKLVGAVGLRELTRGTDTVKGVMSKAGNASPDTTAMSLLSVLTDGRCHAVVSVNAEQRILGLITQTDLLAAAMRLQTADEPPLKAAA